MTNKVFNLIITGVGGQGLITLVSIINGAAFIEGYDVRSSELHGLSQRGGSVLTHIRFGKEVYSPLVMRGKADLILGLELLEGLRGAVFAGEDTKFLINKYSLPFIGGMAEAEVLKNLNEISKDKLNLIPASNICKEKLGKEVVSGIYLLGYAVHKNLIPFKSESVLKAIEKIIPQKYLELNIRAFKLSHDN